MCVTLSSPSLWVLYLCRLTFFPDSAGYKSSQRLLADLRSVGAAVLSLWNKSHRVNVSALQLLVSSCSSTSCWWSSSCRTPLTRWRSSCGETPWVSDHIKHPARSESHHKEKGEGFPSSSVWTFTKMCHISVLVQFVFILLLQYVVCCVLKFSKINRRFTEQQMKQKKKKSSVMMSNGCVGTRHRFLLKTQTIFRYRQEFREKKL